MKLRSKTWKEWKEDSGNFKFVLILIGVVALVYFIVVYRPANRIPSEAKIDHVAIIEKIEPTFVLSQSKYRAPERKLTGWKIYWHYTYGGQFRKESSFFSTGFLSQSQVNFIETLPEGAEVDIKIDDNMKSYLVIGE